MAIVFLQNLENKIHMQIKGINITESLCVRKVLIWYIYTHTYMHVFEDK